MTEHKKSLSSSAVTLSIPEPLPDPKHRNYGAPKAPPEAPAADIEDYATGVVTQVPRSVTEYRRRGVVIPLIKECTPNCWYWELPHGSRYYNFHAATYEEIGRANNPDWTRRGRKLAGPCPRCGNPHTNGGLVTAADVAQAE
jgi:hypothetical protein